MKNSTCKVSRTQPAKPVSKKQKYTYIALSSIMPREYNKMERIKLKEFEKSVLSKTSVYGKSQ